MALSKQDWLYYKVVYKMFTLCTRCSDELDDSVKDQRLPFVVLLVTGQGTLPKLPIVFFLCSWVQR